MGNDTIYWDGLIIFGNILLQALVLWFNSSGGWTFDQFSWIYCVCSSQVTWLPLWMKIKSSVKDKQRLKQICKLGPKFQSKIWFRFLVISFWVVQIMERAKQFLEDMVMGGPNFFSIFQVSFGAIYWVVLVANNWKRIFFSSNRPRWS